VHAWPPSVGSARNVFVCLCVLLSVCVRVSVCESLCVCVHRMHTPVFFMVVAKRTRSACECGHVLMCTVGQSWLTKPIVCATWLTKPIDCATWLTKPIECETWDSGNVIFRVGQNCINTLYMTYIWWFPCQTYPIRICMVLANPSFIIRCGLTFEVLCCRVTNAKFGKIQYLALTRAMRGGQH